MIYDDFVSEAEQALKDYTRCVGNGCVEGLAVGILAVILLTTIFLLCLIYVRRRYDMRNGVFPPARSI